MQLVTCSRALLEVGEFGKARSRVKAGLLSI